MEQFKADPAKYINVEETIEETAEPAKEATGHWSIESVSQKSIGTACKQMQAVHFFSKYISACPRFIVINNPEFQEKACKLSGWGFLDRIYNMPQLGHTLCWISLEMNSPIFDSRRSMSLLDPRKFR